MKKTLSFLLASILIVSTMLFCLPLSASAESLYIRKIVSVVYDDSGSMSGAKCAYANYAMQAFCGMLNSEDQLYITYMNQVSKPQKIDLSSGNIQKSIDTIRSRSRASGGTPYKAVETAYNQLKSVQDSNPNTQYWLVIITDGEFDEYNGMSKAKAKQYLNSNCKAYTASTMPNGTHPQVTFLGIGDVVAPDNDPNNDIFTFSASNATQIINAMSAMADRISGRTRLQSSDVKQIDSNTLQISSSIPLLNIAVLAQGSNAKITSSAYSNGTAIPISRSASLSYPSYSDLVGGAYLLGDSQNVIGAGDYVVTFDRAVSANDIIFLFEPALEMRMEILLNGKKISSVSDLNASMEGDKISVSCNVYEMGTDKIVDPSLLPPGTKFEIKTKEGGTVTEAVNGKELKLSDYVLKNVATEITASATIAGFNPIEYSVKFTPTKYVPRIVYTISSAYGGDVKSVKFDKIANNKDLTVCFTVYADGVPITDPEAVRALNPTITVSPQGNAGTTTYSPDGKIIFTPNQASTVSSAVGSFEVDVNLSIDDGTTSNAKYTVLLAEYAVVPIVTTDKIVKTRFYDNKIGASFYITKDGVKLDKAAVENGISVILNGDYAGYKTSVTVADDGTITVTPYIEEKHELTFFNWWINWKYYFDLFDEDVEVKLNHGFGTATATIGVIDESTSYLVWKVYCPLILEILILAAIVAYIIRYFTKPRFAPNAVLYVGSISYQMHKHGTHAMELTEIYLNQYNKFKNLWNPFKDLTVYANGVSITAAKGNLIICNELFPWFSDGVKSKSPTVKISSPKDVVNYCQEKSELVIHEIKPTQVMDEQNRLISQDDSVYYFVKADVTHVKIGGKQKEIIDSAVAFCYSTIQN